VNSYVCCTKKTSVFVGLLIVFLIVVSLEFLAERFLATSTRETLINECHIPGVNPGKQIVHPLGYT
jgi:hypothetical protein